MKRLRPRPGAISLSSVLGAVVIAGIAISGCASRQATTVASASPKTASTPGPSSGSGVAVNLSRCTNDDLSPTLVSHGGEASQTFSVLVLTNDSSGACSISGYPSITAIGHAQSGPVGMLPIAITHGTYFRPDPGPHLILLAPGQSASCVVETEMAYEGGAHPDTISELRIALPGAVASKTVEVDLGATGPPGKAIPVLITALVAGSVGPPDS